jgi:formylglycine-generating enzyme required for sulfatase activity
MIRPRPLHLALVLVAALVAAAACSESSGGAPASTTPPPEGGVLADASAEATNEASADATASTDARPPDEIIIQVPGAAFAIDTREVSTAEYMLFRASPNVAVASIKGCEWKTSLGPALGCAPRPGADPAQPITCIDWCDAEAYCSSRGKRLCARIGGGPATTNAQRLNPLVDEWVRACAGPLTSDRWPYGSVAMPSLCNTAARDAGTTLPPATLAGCTGEPAELFDMSGNVAEWEDSCAGDGGAGDAASDTCAVRGGSFRDSVDDAKCSHIGELGRADVSPTVGVRCCKDLQQ